MFLATHVLNYVINVIHFLFHKTSHHEYFKSLVDVFICIIESDLNHKETVLSDYFKQHYVTIDNDSRSLSVMFHWKNNTHVSVLYICDISEDYDKKITNEDASLSENKEEYNETVIHNITDHTLKYYAGIKQLMDPCWNVSKLIRFDLPKPFKDNTNFGVHCDLNIRIYDYERIWIFLDTTDTLPTEKFQCPRPYIDTCFLKVLKDINIFTKLLRNRNDGTSKLFNKKIQFFRDICYEQVFKKMK